MRFTFFRPPILFVLLVLSAALPVSACFSTAPAGSDQWERWDDGLPGIAPVLTLAAAPDQPESIYAGTYSSAGLWHTPNGGATWSSTGQTGPAGQAVNTVVWDSARQRWWAGTAGGLFVRPADSTRWRAVAEITGPVLSLATADGGQLFAVQADAGLFRREQNGDWTRLRREPQALAVDASPAGRHMFLGTAGRGLWISHDGGATWQQEQRFPEAYILTLLVDPEAGRWVFRRDVRKCVPVK